MRMMLTFTTAILFMSLALVAVTLQKAYFYVPAKEFQHRADKGDRISAALYSVARYSGEAQLFITAVIVLTAALGTVLFAQVAPLVLGVVVVIVLLVLGFFWQPRTRLTKFEAELATWCAPGIVWLLRYLHTVLQPLASWAEGRRIYQRHTRLFDAEDFEALLERQRRQRDSRLTDSELERMRRALRIGHIQVRDAMTPRVNVQAVNAADPLSPVLVDELHQTGHQRFPVYENKVSNIVGTLAMDAIADVKLHGTVGDRAERKLVYLHEDDTLEHALRAFYETHSTLFVVLSRKGSYAGILTLSSILHELAGELNDRAFGKFDDRESVVHRHAAEEKSSTNETEVVE